MREPKTNLEKIINSSIDEIRQKMLAICENEHKNDLDFLSATNFVAQTKELVKELGCQVVQGYFESRDVTGPYLDKNGNRYLHKGKSKKEIVTSLGKIEISRSYYQHRAGGKSLFPLDQALGINGEILMADVKETVLYSSAYNTPEESSRMLAKCSFIKLHPTQIKRAIAQASDFTEETGPEIMTNVRKKETRPACSDIMVCSLDGVNVLLNQKGIKQGRPVERPTREKDSPSLYKNAMCGSISHYQLKEGQGKKEPHRTETKYIARMPENCYNTFKRDFEEEVKNAESGPSQTKLVITDAHKSISGYLKNNPVFKNYNRIIDFYHACEHLSHLAEALHGKSTGEANDWYSRYREILKGSEKGAVKLIRSAGYYLKNNTYGTTRTKEANRHLGYFKKHKRYMDYSKYKENGWPIGSGVIEAACKSVVKQRMCRSGQRWSIKGGQAILNLRTIVKSERWDNFWSEFTNKYYTKSAA
jgi:hypothetical protein